MFVDRRHTTYVMRGSHDVLSFGSMVARLQTTETLTCFARVLLTTDIVYSFVWRSSYDEQTCSTRSFVGSLFQTDERSIRCSTRSVVSVVDTNDTRQRILLMYVRKNQSSDFSYCCSSVCIFLTIG
jgi:hypothetical protein